MEAFQDQAAKGKQFCDVSQHFIIWVSVYPVQVELIKYL